MYERREAGNLIHAVNCLDIFVHASVGSSECCNGGWSYPCSICQTMCDVCAAVGILLYCMGERPSGLESPFNQVLFSFGLSLTYGRREAGNLMHAVNCLGIFVNASVGSIDCCNGGWSYPCSLYVRRLCCCGDFSVLNGWMALLIRAFCNIDTAV